MNFKEKISLLKEIILSHENFAVAFSGGVDSTFLLLFAKMVVADYNRKLTEEKGCCSSAGDSDFTFIPGFPAGKPEEQQRPHRLTAITAVAPSFSQEDLLFAEKLCENNGIEHIKVTLDSGEMLDVLSSGGKYRCYYCKTYFYSELLKELGVISPDDETDPVSGKPCTGDVTEGLSEAEIDEDYPNILQDLSGFPEPHISRLAENTDSEEEFIGFRTGSSQEQYLELSIPLGKEEPVPENENDGQDGFVFMPLVSSRNEQSTAQELPEPSESAPEERNIPFVLADGTNASDDPSDRPGMKAASELDVISPLRMCEITKDEVRKALSSLDVSIYNKPSSGCYATRIPFGEEIDEKSLRMIGSAENFLHDIGFTHVRVRKQGLTARIEVLPAQIPEFFDVKIMEQIDGALKDFGFEKVSLDLYGYRNAE